jgi:hypothetical protein
MANDIFKSDIDIVRQYIAVNITNNWDTIAPYVEKGLDYLLPYLSEAQHTALLAVADEQSPTATNLKLLKLARRALANIAYYLYQPFSSVNVTDRGLTQEKDTAMPFEQMQFARACREAGYAALSKMLEYLITNQATFTTWKGSAERAKLYECLFVTEADFKTYRMVDGLDTIEALKPSIIHIQQEIIASNITDAVYTDLLSKHLTYAVSGNTATLLNKCRKTIAHLSVAYAANMLNYKLTANGLRIENEIAIYRTNRSNEVVDRKINHDVMKDAQEKGDAALKELRKFMNATSAADVYPSYYNSDLYEADTINSSINQSPSPSFWAIKK